MPQITNQFLNTRSTRCYTTKPLKRKTYLCRGCRIVSYVRRPKKYYTARSFCLVAVAGKFLHPVAGARLHQFSSY